MKKIFLALFLILIASLNSTAALADDTPLRLNIYESGLLTLGTAYQAKLYCTCHFVMKREDKFCKQFVAVSPSVFQITVHEDKKSVEATSLYFWASTARWKSPMEGCVLEE